jgi:4-hydroxy-2-oxoheptanedioate aldolase
METKDQMKPNQTKAKLQAGETVYGCFNTLNEPRLIELYGYQPWDFIVFDGEHAPLEPRDVENLTRAAQLLNLTPLVRATTNAQPTILQYLDTGAMGVVVPWVNTALEAENVVRSVKYFPRGVRGLASVRAADYGQTMSLAEYVAQANAETLVVVQCESPTAVEDAAAIAAVDGVDVVFIGPNDLAQSMGLTGQTDHPDVIAAVERVIAAVTPAGKAVGMMVKSAENAIFWRERGVRFIAASLDKLIVTGMKSYLSAVKG